jgi:hypothetical protein
MLLTSTKLDLTDKFKKYVKVKYLHKLKEIIVSTNSMYDDSKLYSMQIVEDYLLDKDDILNLYWQAIKNYLTMENYDRYFRLL